jgi:hypothetical protein
VKLEYQRSAVEKPFAEYKGSYPHDRVTSGLTYRYCYLFSGFGWCSSRIQQRLKPKHVPLDESNLDRLAAEAQA